jgi:hypothetical protein
MMAELRKDMLISWDGWPDAIRSETLSNHITGTQLPESVVPSCYRVLRRHGQDNAITPEEDRGLQRASVGRRIERRIIHKISFQRTPMTIIKYFYEFYLFKMTSLIPTWDWAVHVWTSIYTN